ncbi:TonB-dependent receptor [Aquimarina sp. U1-2]|uniref:carboxypeptidase-like regulatory domain-containing protein n=1 Tax=Aquimarina sp. U1-2 TaxID=2823141 RepID=UPI001AECA7A9|nr:carboxypeptidase-like regulatory domain-containing protein [Aquimarina sp. U1-2]MBP2833003.1 TonB-dependent receptor [Aquimarina sp. U1-2]
MKKTILIFSVFFMLCTMHSIKAQEKTITGTVTSAGDNAVPLPGVNVIVKGTTKGVQTDFDGNYSIESSPGDVLEFSYIGFLTASKTVAGSNSINVALEESLEQLEDVVVTALGIQKSRKSLTYAAQDINADELNKVKDANPVNSLSGKVAGVVINRSASGVGGSVKLTIRGNTSTRNNQPLYVIDGIPILNNSAIQPNDSFGDIANAGNRDGGDALSLINPEDIESLTILRGASASALYGSQGSNGVVLITTKKGKSGNFKTNVSSNLTVDTPAYLLDFNDKVQDGVDSFLNNGTTAINAISVSGGTEHAQTYFSYANTFAEGVIPTHNVKRHTLNLRETAKLLNDRLTVDASVLLSTQSIRNKPISGLYYNPLVGVYTFNSESETLQDYERFEEFDPSRNLFAQRWFRQESDLVDQNPYWILNRNESDDKNQKLLASLSLKYKFNDWLSIQARGSYDKNMYQFERRMFATTNPTLAPRNGRYLYNELEDLQLYGDIIATINTVFADDFSINANLGTSVRRSDLGEGLLLDSSMGGRLLIPNVFTISNFVLGDGSNPILQQSIAEQKEVQSVFASTTLGYKEMVYLDLTARNDWSSTVSESYFYPSYGLTLVLSEMFEMPESITFAKIRGSYAEVGNDIPSFLNNPIATVDPAGRGLNRPTIVPLEELRPEEQQSFEIGTEWRFFDNRLGFDIGYYKTNTIDQFLTTEAESSTGADLSAFNGGDFENSGLEASITIAPIRNDKVTWDSNINFAYNENEIIRLSDILPNDFIELTPISVNAYALLIKEGGAFGDIYGRKLLRNENGLPIRNENELFDQAEADENTRRGFDLLGNANPDFMMGWNNTISYKNFTLNFLVDGRFGGEVMSLSEAIADGEGTINRPGEVLVFDSVTNSEVSIPAQDFYRTIGGRSGFTGEYIYDATNIRLAELSLGYNFKLNDTSFFNAINASVIGRNLFFFYKEAPYDPNISLSTGNGLQGVDIFGSPSTRSIGVNVGLSF